MERHSVLDSTNRLAAERAAAGAPEGLVVRADRQEAGRGQHGRAWHSPPGGLYLSIVLRPPRLEGLSLVAGLACARAARRFGVEATLRWPNDVFVGERKLAGILSEGRLQGSRIEHAIVGIGMNVNVESFPEGLAATSLRHHDLEEVQQALLEELDRAYALWLSRGFAEIRPAMEALCSTLGRELRLHEEGGVTNGRAVGLGDDGCLVLEDGRRIYSAHRVEHL